MLGVTSTALETFLIKGEAECIQIKPPLNQPQAISDLPRRKVRFGRYISIKYIEDEEWDAPVCISDAVLYHERVSGQLNDDCHVISKVYQSSPICLDSSPLDRSPPLDAFQSPFHKKRLSSLLDYRIILGIVRTFFCAVAGEIKMRGTHH